MANYLAQHPEKAVQVPKEVMSALKAGLQKNTDQPGVQRALSQLKEMEAAGSTRLGAGTAAQRPTGRNALSTVPRGQAPPQGPPVPQQLIVAPPSRRPNEITNVTARPVPTSYANLRETFQRQIKETWQANTHGHDVSLV